MDMQTLSITKTPGLYFCPVCGKPFTQEASHTRHVQYCRRRAATKRTARPRACRHCRMTKSKCDAQWPCSRCSSRQSECVYDKPWPLAADAPGAAAAGTGVGGVGAAGGGGGRVGANMASSSSNETTSGSDSNSPATTDENSLTGQSSCSSASCSALSTATAPFTSVDRTSLMALDVAAPTTLATTTATTMAGGTSYDGSVPSFMLSPSFYNLTNLGSLGSPLPGSVSMATSALTSLPSVSMPSPISMHLPYTAPPDPVLEIVHSDELSENLPQLRRLITSMVRSFPRMMTKPVSMPPFIHRMGCGLHYEDSDSLPMPSATPAPPSFPVDDGSATAAAAAAAAGAATSATAPVHISFSQKLFKPLPLMAACVGISHAFVTRTPHSDEFIWLSIDKEHHAIIQRMNNLSFGEILASIQAITIYTTMRLIVYGRDYFLTDMSLLETMGKLSNRFHELWRGPFTPIQPEDYDPSRSTRPAWEDWVFDETRRRITVTCWLMSLAVNPHPVSFRLVQPQRFPLPSSRRLWEADSRAAWEREFDNDQFEKTILARGTCDDSSKTSKLSTIGDLAKAINRASAAVGDFGRPNNDTLNEDDLLAHWHAGVDSLGMMVTAAAAQFDAIQK